MPRNLRTCDERMCWCSLRPVSEQCQKHRLEYPYLLNHGSWDSLWLPSCYGGGRGLAAHASS
jgi:hypothetical protein